MLIQIEKSKNLSYSSFKLFESLPTSVTQLDLVFNSDFLNHFQALDIVNTAEVEQQFIRDLPNQEGNLYQIHKTSLFPDGSLHSENFLNNRELINRP